MKRSAAGTIQEKGIRRGLRFPPEVGSRPRRAPRGDQYRRRQVKKAKVIAGTGSNATAEAIHLSKSAQDLGADALLSVSPYYNRPTPAGVIKHFGAISKAVDIPIIVYNIPSRTGSNINADTMLELARLPNIAGVKEASGNINQIANIAARAPKDFVVLSGDDAMTLPAMAVGARGVVSVASNIVPELMVQMVEAMFNGKVEEARRYNQRLLPLYSALFLETNPIPIKTAVRLMGLPAGPLRLPLCEMSPQFGGPQEGPRRF